MLGRQIVPLFLVVAGAVAVAVAVCTDDQAWRTFWIGAATSLFAAGLVDGSAVLEARRRERSVLDVVGDRVRRAHQALVAIVRSVFDVTGEATDLSRVLREYAVGSGWNPADTQPHIFPPRTKGEWVAQNLRQLDGECEVALNLGLLTGEAERLVRLDAAVRSGAFVTWLRTAGTMAPLKGGQDLLADQAAEVVDAVQAELRFFAQRNRPGWRY